MTTQKSGKYEIQSKPILTHQLPRNPACALIHPNTEKTTQPWNLLSLQPNPKITKRNEKASQLTNLPYVDDGAFLFELLNEVTEAMQIITDFNCILVK